MFMRKSVITLLILCLPIIISANIIEKCAECHINNLQNKTDVIIIDENILASSVHADLDCVDCHVIMPKQEHKEIEEVLCARCHLEEAKKYAASPHIEGREVSIEDVPNCPTCHGSHDILSKDDPNSKINHKNSVQICITCHEDEHIKDKFDILPEPKMIKAYENSVHGNALMVKGNMDAPACVDCHGSHSFLPSDRPDSPIEKSHISETCGKCHTEIAKEYNESVHGTALKNGVMESPTCTNCHGEHDIKAHLDPDSKIFATHIPETCSACHASERVVSRFGLKADRIATFKESFHGTAIEFGESSVANCASCHGVHNIYPQSNPLSMIHKDNVQQTCGQCHEDLPEDFAQGTVHTSAEDEESGQSYVRKFYYIFIPIIIIAFVIYRILEYKRRVRRVE